MYSYVAFIRGINIGGKTSLPMDELISIFHNLAAENVQTYIRSGNVVFQSKNKLDDTFSEKISEGIEAYRGFRPTVFVLSFAEFDDAVRANPFDNINGKFVHFYFTKEDLVNHDLTQLHAVKTSTEDFRQIKNIFYLYTPDGFENSKVVRKVEKVIGLPMTARNLNTINKIHELLGSYG